MAEKRYTFMPPSKGWHQPKEQPEEQSEKQSKSYKCPYKEGHKCQMTEGCIYCENFIPID